MELNPLPVMLLLVSLIPVAHIQGRVKAVVSIQPDTHVFNGEHVTLRCDTQRGRDTQQPYSWYKNNSRLSQGEHVAFGVQTNQELFLLSVGASDGGSYTCSGQDSEISDAVTLTVSERPPPVLRVSPQSWLTEGDSVTLSCEVTGSSTDWTFSWYTTVPYRAGLTQITNIHGYNMSVELLSDSSRGSGGKYTLSPAALNHTGVYMCRGERGEPAFHTQYSNPQPLWITGESPPVSLIINPNRTQHFTNDSLSLSCNSTDQSRSTGWTVRRYTHSKGVLDCSPCKISSLSTSYTGVYWCHSESGENRNPVNITVQDGDVILESPVHPVSEGHPQTLRCLYRNPKPSNLQADFYKDGSVLQTQTTGEMIIHKVSKSDEGFYHCKHPERGESLKSWVSVRLLVSLIPVAHVQGRVKAVVSIQPDAHVFIGEHVTLRCDTQGGRDTQWSYSWDKNNNRLSTAGGYITSKEFSIWSVGVSVGGSYTCRGQDSEISDAVTLTVSEKPKATVRVNPQSSVYTGDTITLSCELQQGAGWKFHWDKNYQYVNTGATNTNTHNVTVDTETGYRCIARRRNAWANTDYDTDYSDEVRITVREKPKLTVSVNPQSSVYTGDTIPLSCELQQRTGWEFHWYKKNPNSQYVNTGATNTNTLNVTVDTAGETVYLCGAHRRGAWTNTDYYTAYSNEVRITVRVRPKPVASMNPDKQVFSGDAVTLRCDIQDESVSSWQYSWYKDPSHSHVSSEQVYTISGVKVTHTGNYTCRGAERGGSRSSHFSDAVTLTVSERPRAVLSISPQSWLTEGDSVTLSCEVTGSSTDWTFSWYTTAPYRSGLTQITNSRGYNVSVELLSDSSRGSGGKYTLSPAALNHTGIYMCRGERGEPAFHTQYSNPQPLWITGESPPVSLIINPNRTQHFTSDSLSLSCNSTDQSRSTGWTVRRYTHSEGVLDCSPCKISSLSTSYTGVSWCHSESGENRNPVNITVQDGAVILESPVHPVTEGHPLTLRCLYRNPKPSNLRVDFYKVGSVLQTQTTKEMIIHKVSKSHEGFYHCKHPERGESLKSWVSVRLPGFRSSGGTVGVAVGLGFLFIALLILMILLWSYKRKKEKQQKTNQTSDQNQRRSGAEDSQAGHTPLQAGTEHIYDTVAQADTSGTGEAATESSEATYAKVTKKKKANRNNGADAEQGAGVGDVTYAEIELKPPKKSKKVKERASLAEDTVYSELQQNMKSLLEQGVVRPCTSSYNTPVNPVPKPDGTWHFTQDLWLCGPAVRRQSSGIC
ncbi:obscurin-like [Neoarius graeffei]|uniref:obscurin-like n=1 Tax=Neoarius graeffei TaxID=443677 RepID=UPI00298D1DED|nr:obscurin-like [Neoarius graeffei]